MDSIEMRSSASHQQSDVGIRLIEKEKAIKNSCFLWRFNRQKGDWENSQRTTEVIQMDRDLNVLSIYPSMKEAVKNTGCHQGLISACCQGKRNHTGGFCFRYGRTMRKKVLGNIYSNPELLK